VKDKVMFGKKKIAMLTQQQRHYQARYQAGKVFAATWSDLPYEKITLSNESITPPSAEPLLKHEIESQIRIHLAGIAACDLRFGEHASNASHDVAAARELVHSMIFEYGMGPSLIPSEQDCIDVIDRLYTEIKTLLEQYGHSVDKLENILNEYEQISKALAKETMNDVL
ncbi:MAG TPA: ATP-dependent metallopeptidase FtsH/Yme1/Tma family protein, partial [Sulfuricurvum sp.]|nr:ATP-dependent metallopeptidase FtsH/Yme1/Tma family protein [Sulfuricurvum sp.]